MESKEVKVRVKHNEVIQFINPDTGKIRELQSKPNNIPSTHTAKKMDKFFKMNNALISKLKHSGLLSMEEIGVITYMSTVSEWNTNSLKPLNDDTSLRNLSEFFLINKSRVKQVLDKLFKLGVYMQIKIHKDDLVDYWVLNPNISWKGTLSEDSLFIHFEGTVINSLI